MGAQKKQETKAAPTGRVNSYDEELARLAAQGAKTEANTGTGGNSLSVKSLQFKYGGNLLGSVIRVVVLDHALENAFYEEDYDADNPVPPDCYAMGREEEEMAHHEKSSKPRGGKGGDCATCPLNAWGSGAKGRSKACKNTRRLLVMLEDGVASADSATVAVFRPSVTNVKGWAKYVKDLSDLAKKATIQVVTEISIHADPKNQYALSFKNVGEVDKKYIGPLLDRRKAEERLLFEPYSPAQPREKPAARGAAKYAKKR